MKNDILFENGCIIYPGAYVPLLKEEEVISALKSPHEGETILPPVNITEMADSFKVEVAIPGVKREDFLIHSEGNILSVCVLNKECKLHEGEKFQLHEFNYECFDRNILLPKNADSEFTIAEYKSGILRLYVPKAKQSARKQRTLIVVY